LITSSVPRPPRIFWILLVVAALLRVAVIHLRDEGVLYRAPDEDEFFLIARSVAHGDGFALRGETTAYRDMLLPVITAGTIKLFGDSALPMLYLQVVLSCASAYLLYLIGRRRFSDKAALWMGIAWMFYPGAILLSAMLFTETLFVLFWLLALVFYDRMEDRNFDLKQALPVGLALGFCLLARQVGVILLASIVIYVAFIRYETAWRIRWKAAAGIIAVCLLVILPWMIRNKIAVDAFALNTNGGINMFIGNNEQANGAYKLKPEQEATLPSSATEGESSRRIGALAGQFIRDHPGQVLKLMPRKFAFLWSTDAGLLIHYFRPEGPPHAAERLRMHPIWLLLIVAPPYMLYVCLGISGFYLVRHFPTRGLFILQVLLAMAAVLVSFGTPRFHVPLIPAMLVGAGALSVPRAWLGAPPWRRLFLLFTLGMFAGMWLFEGLTIAGL
jgi:4-amino-4-deoxy-L-arabinose transferase-like glycosyltransferase